jgi:Zn-dependent M28 family amino/carboxypeptidase
LKINKEKDLLFQIKARGKAANSDHYPFSEMGVPSFFFYTLGKESNEYHSPRDDLKNVHFSDYNDLFELITTFVEDL